MAIDMTGVCIFF